MALNTSDWKEFRLTDICDISMGNKMDFSAMNFDNPSVAFVGRSDKNNGVAGFVNFVTDKEGNDIQPYKAGSLTVALGGTLGTTFIQLHDFYTSQNVSVLSFPNNVSIYAKLFIAQTIMLECRFKYYPFGRELNSHIKRDFSSEQLGHK